MLLLKMYITSLMVCVSAFLYYTYKLHLKTLTSNQTDLYNRRSLNWGTAAVILFILGVLFIVWI